MKPYNTVPKLQDYEYGQTGYVMPPEPSLNGGHYTGEPFKKDAKYRDFPVKADAFYMNKQLQTPGSQYQDVSSHRPGNNLQLLGVEKGMYESVGGVTCRKRSESEQSTICAYNSFSDDYSTW